MSEFTEMIHEAFLGEEPYDPSPGRRDLEASIRKFESRDRTMRLLAWSTITVMGAVFFVSAGLFWTAGPETGTKSLILYATLSLWAMMAIGFMKSWLFSIQASLGLRKDLRRLQLALTERES